MDFADHDLIPRLNRHAQATHAVEHVDRVPQSIFDFLIKRASDIPTTLGRNAEGERLIHGRSFALFRHRLLIRSMMTLPNGKGIYASKVYTFR